MSVVVDCRAAGVEFNDGRIQGDEGLLLARQGVVEAECGGLGGGRGWRGGGSWKDGEGLDGLAAGWEGLWGEDREGVGD